ncbi:hypothetical protein Pla110_25850 [Polystyrenella longa]|uniref:DUF3467 domain-containing protein n=1 Tax=Polystyrenella longa TaxID=2528007 RepID=A0A518CNQ4_9PLAN|nr:DUF3467 domain-containing protein [Polystyrenella longa]QDU80849.1 hypothetical protein Pla110_25850 [Polystyrenella longa]
MTSDPNPFEPAPEDKGPNQPMSHEIRHSQASALVPEQIATGVYSTGAMVFQGSHEFVLDFMMRLGKPHQLVARIILAPSVIPSILRALKSNLDSFDKQFHPEKTQSSKSNVPQEGNQESDTTSPAVSEHQVGSGVPGSSESIVNPNPGAKVQNPGPEEQTQQIEDLYSELKIPSEVMSGQYANAVLIGHSANEISFDFITTFFPRSAVASRIHMAIPTARRLLDSLAQAHRQYLQRQKPSSPPPSPDPPEQEPPSGPIV